MKHIRFILLGLIVSMGSPVFAADSTHTVVGFLSMQKGRLMSFFVNPASESRLTLNILNPRTVMQKLKRQNYSGLVRVEMNVMDQIGEEASVQILKIQPVRARRVPTYDGNFAPVPSGRG